MIPALDENGLLPVGVYDCTMEEIERVFGRFQSSDQRPRLFQRLSDYAKTLREHVPMARCLIVDGSFVTAKETPGDIDLVVILNAAFTLNQPMTMSAYNALDKNRVKRVFPFDIFFASEGTALADKRIEDFQKLKERNDLRKGVLRVWLS